jgi:hypothetical protein
MRNFRIKIIVLGILLSACHKEFGFGSSGSSAPTVYTAGFVYDNISNTAVYWKNTTGTALPPVTNNNDNSYAYAIAVAGNDVYVLGSGPNGNLLWKNGASLSFPAGCVQPTAITADGSDFYVTGTKLNPADPTNQSLIAAYWKNGAEVDLSPGQPGAYATSISVYDGDVYLAGGIDVPGTLGYACYWKNGMLNRLTPDSVYSAVGNIVVDQGNIYIAGGVASNGAVYWKNDSIVYLPADGNHNVSGGFIAIAGGDVYVAGAVNNPGGPGYRAVYWKNNQLNYLTGAATASETTCITTHGTDVYIGGMAADPTAAVPQYNPFVATYWKNGVPTTLPYPSAAGYHYVFGIWVSDSGD